jgi:hypothetical protein
MEIKKAKTIFQIKESPSEVSKFSSNINRETKNENEETDIPYPISKLVGNKEKSGVLTRMDERNEEGLEECDYKNRDISLLDFDKTARGLHRPGENQQTSSQIISTFNYWKIVKGNNITDMKPKLIEMPTEVCFTSHVSAIVLQTVLEELCCLKRNEIPTFLICNTIEEARFISYTLNLIKGFKYTTYLPDLISIQPTIEDKEKILSEFNEFHCILTTNNGVKGLEVDRVVMFAEKNEYILRHLAIEIIARAHVSAFVVMFNTIREIEEEKDNTLGKVFEILTEKKVMDVECVKFVEDNENDELFQRKPCLLEMNSVYIDKKEEASNPEKMFEEYMDNLKHDKRFAVNVTHEYVR